MSWHDLKAVAMGGPHDTEVATVQSGHSPSAPWCAGRRAEQRRDPVKRDAEHLNGLRRVGFGGFSVNHADEDVVVLVLDETGLLVACSVVKGPGGGELGQVQPELVGGAWENGVQGGLPGERMAAAAVGPKSGEERL